jgi:hypothetical protein
MKSKLFSLFDLNDKKSNEAFLKDLSILSSLTTEQYDLVAKGILKLSEPLTKGEKNPIISALATSAGLEIHKLYSLLSLSDYFLERMRDDDLANDTIETWADDLQDAEYLNKKAKSNFLYYLSLLKNSVLSKVSDISKQRATSAGLLPSFKSCSTMNDLRAVLTHPYKWGTPIKEYEPSIESVVPIITVRIGVDTKENSSFVFQATPQEVDYLINELLAAKKSMQRLEKKIILK